MKNIYSHIKIQASLNLIKSLIFHYSKKARKISVSKSYFGLSAYIDYKTKLAIKKSSKVVFIDNGFLVCGTENSSFEHWAGPNKIQMDENSEFIISGYVNIGRGSLIWILDGGKILIGQDTSTSGNNLIISKSQITIGNGCQIAWGVTICDHDFHKTYSNGIENPETLPIIIGNNVWIGMNATILKGVIIGDNAIIAAGAVVTQNIPNNTMYGGIPAKLIKNEVEFYG